MLAEICEIEIEVLGIELDAHEEEAGLLVWMLIGMQDVASVAKHEISDRRDFALRVGAGDQKYGRVLHGSRSSCWTERRCKQRLCSQRPLLFQYPKDLARGICSRATGQSRARVRAASAEIQIVDWRPIPRPIQQRTHREELIQRQLSMEDLATGQSVFFFQVARRDDLVREDQFRQIRGVLG